METVWGNTLDRLYSVILQKPLEDAPRYMFADALIEYANGYDADCMRLWAEFIRKQIECSLRACDKCVKGAHQLRDPNRSGLYISAMKRCQCEAYQAGEEASRMLTREVKMFYPMKRGQRVDRNHPRYAPGGIIRDVTFRQWLTRSLPDCPLRRVEFSRGMVDAVTMRCYHFVKNAQRLFEFYPILYVTLHDVVPDLGECETGIGYISHRTQDWENFGESWEVPYNLWHVIHNTPDLIDMSQPHSRRTARLYLMRGCLMYGRAQAGLDPLSPQTITDIAVTE